MVIPPKRVRSSGHPLTEADGIPSVAPVGLFCYIRAGRLGGRHALHSFKRAGGLQLYREAKRFYPAPKGVTYNLAPQGLRIKIK